MIMVVIMIIAIATAAGALNDDDITIDRNGNEHVAIMDSFCELAAYANGYALEHLASARAFKEVVARVATLPDTIAVKVGAILLQDILGAVQMLAVRRAAVGISDIGAVGSDRSILRAGSGNGGNGSNCHDQAAQKGRNAFLHDVNKTIRD